MATGTTLIVPFISSTYFHQPYSLPGGIALCAFRLKYNCLAACND